MSAIFVSHASADDALVADIEQWLREHGYSDLYVDHTGIVGGDRWQEELTRAAGACRVVLCVVTDAWLGSLECYSEFRAARYMGKRILPILLIDIASVLARGDTETAARLRRVLAEDQGLDLTSLIDQGQFSAARDEARAADCLRSLRAAGASTRVGLDPEAFAIDRDALPSPFPGLASFDDTEAHAALFFGRSREIAEVLEQLRAARASGARRPLMILGASGSGKSSLLKAGVLPRLRREAPGWIALRAFRPGADPLFNFAEAIAKTLAERGKREASGLIRQRLARAWEAAPRVGDVLTDAGWAALRAALHAEGAALREAYARPDATLLLSVDQAEELSRADDVGGLALADYLRAALLVESGPEAAGEIAPPVDWRLAFTIRTDSFPELQRHPRFRDLDCFGYDLRSLPVFRFNDVVEAPARRYGVEIDPALVEALMEDAPDRDALPLLAFAMQRLWRRYAEAGRIRETDYRAERGLAGLVEDAAERALRGIGPGEDKPLPKAPPDKRKLALAERVFVPPLVQVNDDGEAIRRVAAWSEFDDEAQALLAGFEEWRLVVRKAEAALEPVSGVAAMSDTAEVAHEALFREWPRLKAWLEPVRERLDSLRSVEVAAARWERQGRLSADLAHFGQRLAEAGSLIRLDRFAGRLGETERAYIDACTLAARRSRGRRRLLQTTAFLLGIGVTGSSLWVAYETEIRREWARATQFEGLSVELVATLAPGESFRECRDGVACAAPEMVVLPKGAFLMGSPEGVGDADEHPQHEVTIDYQLAVGRFEVTHSEWAACVEASPAEVTDFGCAKVSDSGFGFGDRPVNNVNWYEAKGYIAWLNYMTSGSVDGPYRLLSEAEWEYAARAVTSADTVSTAYFWGDDPEAEDMCGYANVMTADTIKKYSGFRGEVAACEDGHVETAPVGSFKPNAFGLFDLSGNVWEWVEDCGAGYATTPRDGSAETKAGCDRAVLRGGSWNDAPQYLRSAFRYRSRRDDRISYIGFRVARTLDP